MGWDYNSHIVCMCLKMRWSRNLSASWAERFWTFSLLCTYKLCDYYSPIPILSPFLFTPPLYARLPQSLEFTTMFSKVFHLLVYKALPCFVITPFLYMAILNLQDFSFSCIQSITVLCHMCTYDGEDLVHPYIQSTAVLYDVIDKGR